MAFILLYFSIIWCVIIVRSEVWEWDTIESWCHILVGSQGSKTVPVLWSEVSGYFLSSVNQSDTSQSWVSVISCMWKMVDSIFLSSLLCCSVTQYISSSLNTWDWLASHVSDAMKGELDGELELAFTWAIYVWCHWNMIYWKVLISVRWHAGVPLITSLLLSPLTDTLIDKYGSCWIMLLHPKCKQCRLCFNTHCNHFHILWCRKYCS